MLGLMIAAATFGQAPETNWHPLPDSPGSIGLWRGEEYLGRLDPFKGHWEGFGKKTVDLIGWTRKVNPARNTGDTEAKAAPAVANPKPAEADNAVGKPVICEGGDDCECPRCVRKRGANGKRDNPPQIPKGGVDLDRVAPGGERFSLMGHDSTRAEAMSAIEAAGKVPDDGGLNRLTVIGGEAARKQVLADLATSPDLAYWRDKLVIQSCAADSWLVKDRGFKLPTDPSKPVIYVQRADGTVYWRQDDYAGGAPALAKALRDRVPGYDPARDPQPRSPDGPAIGGVLPVWLPWLAVPLAGVLGFWLSRRKV